MMSFGDVHEKWIGGHEMGLIKVGLEATREDLRKELLEHPCKYFFILLTDREAALCIRTCDCRGEDLLSHVVDGLKPDPAGNLISIFEEDLQVAVTNRNRSILLSDGDELFSISRGIAEKIRILPGFVDWIISSVLTGDRNILIHPIFWADKGLYSPCMRE